MIVEHTIEIERPIEEVFDVATCMHRCTVWMSPVSSSWMDSDEPARVGSTFSGTQHFLGQTHQAKGIIPELDPPRYLRFKQLSGLGFSGSYTFTPTESGTRFRLTVEPDGGPIIESVEEPSLLKVAIKSQVQKDMEHLKMLMESDVDLWASMPA